MKKKKEFKISIDEKGIVNVSVQNINHYELLGLLRYYEKALWVSTFEQTKKEYEKNNRQTK